MDAQTRASIERDCERLVSYYSVKADFGEAEAAASTYIKDGWLQVGERRFDGRDAIQKRIKDFPTGQVSRHFCSNQVIEIQDQDHATGIVYVALYRGQQDDAAPGKLPVSLPLLMGHYEDNFVRTEDGWRFANRKLVVTFASPKSAQSAQK